MKTPLLIACLTWALTACSLSPEVHVPATFDLGAPASTVAQPQSPPIRLAEMQAAPWLDSTDMIYRLNYQDGLNTQAYAESAWIAPPARLLTTRLKHKLGMVSPVLNMGDSGWLPMLRVELEEFAHTFDSPTQSAGRVRLTAQVLQRRRVLGTRIIERSVPATSADARGGVRALAQASDAAIEELTEWIRTLPLEDPRNEESGGR